MFLTPIEKFDVAPYVVGGKIQSGQVVIENDFSWQDQKTGIVYTVPAGFVCDLASFPWLAGWLLDKLGRNMRAAALHDWLYRNKINGKHWADLQLLAAAKQDSVSAARQLALYGGVFVGGWLSWWFPQSVLILTEGENETITTV